MIASQKMSIWHCKNWMTFSDLMKNHECSWRVMILTGSNRNIKGNNNHHNHHHNHNNHNDDNRFIFLGCCALWCFPCFTCRTLQEFNEPCAPPCCFDMGCAPAVSLAVRYGARRQYGIQVQTQHELLSFPFHCLVSKQGGAGSSYTLKFFSVGHHWSQHSVTCTTQWMTCKSAWLALLKAFGLHLRSNFYVNKTVNDYVINNMSYQMQSLLSDHIIHWYCRGDH